MGTRVGHPLVRAAVFLVLALATGCERGVPTLHPEVLRVFPHDTTAYTQGLIYHEGRLFESTGQYGSSTVREVDPVSGEVLRMLELDEVYFGEGLALIGDRLIQLTWREGVAFVRDVESFDEVDRFEYEGEGWGLCHDGTSLYMTTGGSFLFRRDPDTFELLGSVQVTEGGSVLRQVNELACVGDYVYGNVYMTDRIVQIDKHTGVVVASIDASGLHPPGGRPRQVDAVLNGITWIPERDTFLITGKLWSAMFEVRFVPSP